jgi:16S rRNA (guanine527-N7)-methyltransferase
MPTQIDKPLRTFIQALTDHASEFRVRLSDEDIEKLENYYELLLKWNSRLHLVAPCTPEHFARRHILESLLLLRHLPTNARLVDVGSGAGLPIIPCLILRDDLRATLIESSQRKAVFLREALRGLPKPESAEVIAGRFEDTPFPRADFLTCRAIDRFQQVLPNLIDWAPPPTTFLLFAAATLKAQIDLVFSSIQTEQIPGSHQRFLVIARGTRVSLSEASLRETIC